jgi:hypothetical protein
MVDDQNEPTIEEKYRALFNHGFGTEILADILMNCHFGITLDPDNKAQIAEYNVGIAIAAKAGFLEEVDSLLGLPRKGA